MYDRGYTRSDVLSLFRVIDWMLRLPVGLEQEFWRELHEMEESKNMPYVTSVERLGREEGLKQGLEQGLEQKREALREAARNLLLRTRFDDASIAEIIGIDIAEVEALRAELGH